MSITKRKLASGKYSWGYLFSVGPRKNRQQHKQSGYKTKDEAIHAEAEARLRAASTPVPKADPKSVAHVIASFIADGEKQRSPKTTARYKELAAYISPELKGRAIAKVTALMWHEEWKRLKESGGHTRRDKTPRPLSSKTVRNIAGVVSAAYSWAILYEIVSTNPVTASKPPRGGDKRKAVALTTSQQDMMIAAATGPWCLGMFLEMEAALGARRGEILALRWSDIQAGYAFISRSLGQVGGETYYKTTKTGISRKVEIPSRTLAALEVHRQKQNEFRAHFGADYATSKDLIFATPEGHELKPDSVSGTVSAICRRLKLPRGANLHALRHTHGSVLVDQGVPITQVAERLGHVTPATTLQIYSHAIPERSEAAQKWEQAQEKRKDRRQ